MKKFLSLIIALIMTASMAVVSFAANKANFSITSISETDKELVISVDYDGGSSFSCFDFELSVNTDKLEIVKSEEGKGVKSFNEYASSNGGSSFPMSNIVSKGLLKASFVSLVNYKNIKEKDIFIITIKKLKSGNVQKGDVTLKFTSCAIMDSNGNVTEVTPVITSKISGTENTSSKAQSTATSADNSVGKTQNEDKSNTSVSENSQTVQEITQQSITQQQADDSIPQQTEETEQNNNSTVKTVIIILASALALAIAVTAVVIIVKKKKK